MDTGWFGIPWEQVQWGTVGQWVSGIGSLAAVATAIILAYRSAKSGRSRYARRVVVTPEVLGRPPKVAQVVQVYNGSAGPIRYVTTLNPDTTTVTAVEATVHHAMVRPGQRTVLDVPENWQGFTTFTDPESREWRIDRRDKLQEVRKRRRRR